jgi:nitrous oxidase accessory protein NosD
VSTTRKSTKLSMKYEYYTNIKKGEQYTNSIICNRYTHLWTKNGGCTQGGVSGAIVAVGGPQLNI